MSTDQQMVEQFIIGKRIMAISWLPEEGEGETWPVIQWVMLEGGLKLVMGLTEIASSNRVNARCVYPLCDQGHDPKLIGDSGEGKDANMKGDREK